MSYFQEFDSVRSPSENMEQWFLPCLLLAVLIHVGFFWWSHSEMREFPNADAPELTEQPPPPPITIERVEIDPAVFEGEVLDGPEAPPAKPIPDLTKLEMPADKISFENRLEEVRATPAAPEITQELMATKPRELASSFSEQIAKMEDQTRNVLEKDLHALNQQLLEDKPKFKGRTLPVEKPGYSTAKSDRVGPASNLRAELEGATGGPNTGRPGFSNLDDLISNAGPMTKPTAQIMMPADLLFAYDRAELSASAIPSLQKLGTVIKMNPGTTIAIEGHTDAFGGDDYNQILSEKRALAVKIWLVAYAGIDPTRITTYGFGRRRLLAPGSGTIEEQQINRRVEIVIRKRQR